MSNMMYYIHFEPNTKDYSVWCEALQFYGFGSFETEALAEKFVRAQLLELARDILVALA